MNRLVICLILFASLIIVACNNEKADRNDKEQKTIKQAMLDSQIDTDDIFYTEKIDGQDAFSIYKATDGYGIIHYQKEKKRWQYQGSSGFGHSPSGHSVPVTFGAASWQSSQGNNTFNTVFLGEIMEPEEIAKIILEVNHGKYNANIITSNNRAFWYLLSEEKTPHNTVTKISGYSSSRELVYENYINKPQ